MTTTKVVAKTMQAGGKVATVVGIGMLVGGLVSGSGPLTNAGVVTTLSGVGVNGVGQLMEDSEDNIASAIREWGKKDAEKAVPATAPEGPAKKKAKKKKAQAQAGKKRSGRKLAKAAP